MNDPSAATHLYARPFELAGATALVTGAAKRLGRALALGLADAGADVIVHYRTSADEAAEVCRLIEGKGRAALAVQADFARAADWTAWMEECRSWQGAVDILVNNASLYPVDTPADVSEAQLLENMRVHAFAPLVLARTFARGLERGRLLNLLDTRVLADDRRHLSYHLSKRTLYSLTKLLALEYAPRITVNGIAPGPVLPPPDEDAAYLERARSFVPLNRVGTEAEIVQAALFLLRSDFITGEVLFVDGGRHLLGGPYG